MRRIVGKLRTCLRFSGAELRLVAASLVVAWLARVGLWLLPFRLVLRAAGGPGHRAGRRDGVTVERIAWAVRLASRYVPRPTCLVQALTGRVLMGWYGHASELQLGVAMADRGIEAHAWLECAGQVLLGGSAELQRYKPFTVPCGRRA